MIIKFLLKFRNLSLIILSLIYLAAILLLPFYFSKQPLILGLIFLTVSIVIFILILNLLSKPKPARPSAANLPNLNRPILPKQSNQEEIISILKEENIKLNTDLNKAIYEILALYEFTYTLGSDVRLDQLNGLMVDTIKRILDYDGCCLLILDENQKALLVKVNRGFTSDINNLKFPVDTFFKDLSLKNGQAVIINNLDQDYPGFREAEQYRHLFGHFKSFILLPLSVQEKSIGVLLIAKSIVSGFSSDDLRLLMVIANQAALNIQNKRLYEQAYYTAITDGLTGVYNHKYFREQLELQLNQAKQYGFKISLLIIDIDHFKRFNDTYGHQVGDMVLKEVASLLQDCVISDNLVARYGGEEFVIILPDSNLENAVLIANIIRSTIEHHIFSFEGQPDLKVTVSLGAATFPDHIKNMDRMVGELIDVADEGLYQAKNSGRNKVCAPT